MNKLMIAVAFVALADLGLASQKPNPKRMDALWGAAMNRLVEQNDAWWEAGDYPRIVQSLKYMHQLNPTDYETTTDLGWMLENIERTDEALAVYIDFRKKNPKMVGSEFPEAFFYDTHKLYSKVPSVVEPKIASKHATANSFRILAHSYEKMGLLEDAKRTWGRYGAVSNDPVAKFNVERITKKMQAKPKA